MTREISVADFDAIYDTFATSVWRWETQSSYEEPDEQGPFAQWLATGQDDLSWLRGWLDLVSSATKAGKSIRRVRRIDLVPNDYQRWLGTAVHANVEAGEDVRALATAEALRLALPEYDFLLVDDHSVAKMQFDCGRFVGAVLLEDADTVERHRAWLAAAWKHASPIDGHQRSP